MKVSEKRQRSGRGEGGGLTRVQRVERARKEKAEDDSRVTQSEP